MDLTQSTDLCRLLADSTRARLLALLAEEELTVAELTRITGLAQSRVSTHLGKLRDAKLVRDRRNGTSNHYSSNLSGLPESARRMVAVLRENTVDPVLDADLERVSDVIRARDPGNWAESVAGRMHRHYSPGRTWEASARAVLGLARLGRVLDVACGDGVLAELLAPRAASVTGIDASAKVVSAARKRLAHLANVEFVEGDMQALPFGDGSFDQISLMNALTYASEPALAVLEAARVLSPGGRLVGTTLARHPHTDDVTQYNHVNSGFDAAELKDWLVDSGLDVELCAVSCRERRKPYFEVITFHALRPERS